MFSPSYVLEKYLKNPTQANCEWLVRTYKQAFGAKWEYHLQIDTRSAA